MSTLTKDQEQFIEHEVKIRVHDEKFQIIERDLEEMKSTIRHLDGKFDSQFKWIIGMFVSSIIIPVILHFVKAV